MSNVIISRPEIGDAGILTASSNASNAPVSNLQRMQPTDIWQSVGLDNVSIIADLGSVKTINLVSLLFANTTEHATWRVRMANTVDGTLTSPIYDGPGDSFGFLVTENGDNIVADDTGAQFVCYKPVLMPSYVLREDGSRIKREDSTGSMLREELTTTHGVDFWASYTEETRRTSFLWIPETVQARYVRIDIYDSNNPDGFIRAGRLYISNAWQPHNNMNVGASFGWSDLSSIEQTTGGNLISDKKPKRPILEFTLSFVSRADMTSNLYEIDRVRGASRDVLICTDPDDLADLHKNIYYGLLSDGRKSVAKTFNMYEITYTLRGLL